MRTPLQTAGIKLQGGMAHAADAYTAPVRAAGEVAGAAGDLTKAAVGAAVDAPKNAWKWANTPRPVAQ
ncbi:hypothetical protein [Verrucomicrobium sp. BvORR106]|uniref:hypothetical protein n=1 Tax=Verrucomicrobium sp. BvORR106 TaxID=1403819 RepID=UPI00056E7D66|nr:hypothetical protein [Verrucomicrobium sp. BvORR106]